MPGEDAEDGCVLTLPATCRRQEGRQQSQLHVRYQLPVTGPHEQRRGSREGKLPRVSASGKYDSKVTVGRMLGVRFLPRTCGPNSGNFARKVLQTRTFHSERMTSCSVTMKVNVVTFQLC
jgi:hypothetical protein